MTRKSVSISLRTATALVAHCAKYSLSQAGIVEALLADLPRLPSERPAPARPDAVGFPVSADLFRQIAIAAKRSALTVEVAFERALGRMLDRLVTSPWCRGCLEHRDECRCGETARDNISLGTGPGRGMAPGCKWSGVK